MIVLLLYHVKIISGLSLYVEGGKGILDTHNDKFIL